MSFTKLKKVFIATSIALSSSLAMADGVSYDYIQGGIQDYDDQFDGLEFEGSMSFNQNWYGKAELMKGETNVGNADVDRIRLNVGFHTPINNSVDFVAEAGFEDYEIGGFDDSGFNALAGFRGMASQNFELGGYAQYSDVLESTDLIVEGRYHFNRNMSVGVEVGNDDELDNHYGANFRYSF